MDNTVQSKTIRFGSQQDNSGKKSESDRYCKLKTESPEQDKMVRGVEPFREKIMGSKMLIFSWKKLLER